ncbi:MAG TPA: hypothetical protein VMW13_02310 [Dehalococcoidales bacterium]|nr:hypothetical protein [Dehalococcoidales bacterium]
MLVLPVIARICCLQISFEIHPVTGIGLSDGRLILPLSCRCSNGRQQRNYQQ